MGSSLKLFAVLLALKSVASLPQVNRNQLDESHQSEVLINPDTLAGERLIDWASKGSAGNPEEQGGYFEGDIIISVQARHATVAQYLKWMDGKVPYVVKGNFSKQEKTLLNDAIAEYKKKTCIKLIPRTKEVDYVVFDNAQTGCWSHVGRVGGPQIVNLQSTGCTTLIGTILHEILHALGFLHEQNRADRDKHIKINYDNIKADMFDNFKKVPEALTSSFNVTYDYDSVVHYSAYAFSTNKKATIEAISDKKMNARMGQRKAFSQGDIDKVNAMYCSKN